MPNNRAIYAVITLSTRQCGSRSRRQSHYSIPRPGRASRPAIAECHCVTCQLASVHVNGRTRSLPRSPIITRRLPARAAGRRWAGSSYAIRAWFVARDAQIQCGFTDQCDACLRTPSPNWVFSSSQPIVAVGMTSRPGRSSSAKATPLCGISAVFDSARLRRCESGSRWWRVGRGGGT